MPEDIRNFLQYSLTNSYYIFIYIYIFRTTLNIFSMNNEYDITVGNALYVNVAIGSQNIIYYHHHYDYDYYIIVI